MKRLYLIILIAVLAQLPAMAQTWYSNDFRLKFERFAIGEYSDVTVSAATWSISGSLEIPASTTYEGVTYPVTSIGEDAFRNCTGLTEVTIPNSVTSIRGYAFYGCTGLTEVTIGNSVTSIRSYAFCGCTGLTEVTIPNSITSFGDGTFSGCTGLTGVTIVDGEAELNCSSGLFSNCPISKLYLGRNIAYDPSHSYSPFKDKSTLTSLTIGNRVTTIGKDAFYGCTGLTKVTIPNSVTTIGSSAFARCSGLTEVTIPNSVTTIGDYAFARCSGLTEVTIPNSVTTIGDYAFRNCTGLTEVTIPNSVTTIGSFVFSDCTGLTEVTIGNSVTEIDDSAFRNCTGLTEVTIVDGEAELSIFFNSFENCPISKLYLGRNTAYYEPYYYPSPFNSTLTSLTIGNCVTTIGEYAFRNCTGLTDIVIPASVKNIGSGAFENTHIRTVTMNASNPIDIQNANPFDVDFVYALFVPTGSKRLYSRAKEWENFKNIFEIGPSDVIDVVKDGVRYGIKSEDTAFAVSPKRSERKSDIIINSTIEINGKQYPVEIADYAFDNVMEINTVEITDGIKVISPYAFHGSGIESVKLPKSVETIGSNAFAYSELTAIEIPNSVTSIGSEALRATKLTALNIPSSITQIPSSLCSECKQLKQINLGLSISDIGQYAFSGCTGLTAIHLPNSVKIIPKEAFSNTGIYELSVPNSVTTLESMCFSNCEHLQRVEIVDGSEQLYINKAFSGSPVKDFYVGRDLDYSDSRNMTALETLRFGKSVKTIGNFNGCKNVTEIWCANPVPPAGPSDAFDGIGYTTCKLYVPVGSYTAYESTKPWSYILDIQEREFVSGVENVTFDGNAAGDIDFNAPVEVYNLQGVMVGNNMNGLSAGIYIVRQGRNIKKIAVK